MSTLVFIVFEKRNDTVLYYLYNGDEILGFIYNGNTYYYHKNIFGDIIGILNSNYQEIVKYTYDNYGNITSTVDNSGIGLGTLNPFRYRSYYYDEETGLYYLNSRYYNPQWGRFINADAYVSTGQGFNGNNMFTYCGNNPIGRKENGNNWFKDVASSFVQNVTKYVPKKVKYAVIKTTQKAINALKNNSIIGSSTAVKKYGTDIKISEPIPYIGGMGVGFSNTEYIVTNPKDTFISFDRVESGDSTSSGISIGSFSISIDIDWSDGLSISNSIGLFDYSIKNGLGITSDFRIENLHDISESSESNGKIIQKSIYCNYSYSGYVPVLIAVAAFPVGALGVTFGF